jgi:2-polyprenyl-6-methoxyphenol hydroxylase-like FAD-dependent oxidoreductase
MLASTVLSRYHDAVTVIDRDRLPEGPELRKGVPQAQHAHLLWSGGARLIDALLPGTTGRLYDRGAHRLAVPTDVVSLTAFGWQHRFPEAQFLISASRELLDWVVRDQATRNDRITVLGETAVRGLTGTAQRVTGVCIDGRELDADIVVDTTGRGSPLRSWLTELGATPPEQDIVDTGMAYATRIFRAPPGSRSRFPAVCVYADHRDPRPGRNAVLMPIERDRWIVTLSGTRGGEPPVGEASFTTFAQDMRHPIVGELIAAAEPLTSVRGSRSTANRRLRLDRLDEWPVGLVVLGDALAAFNPVYGHGMSAAARSATALDREFRRRQSPHRLTRNAQRSVNVAVDDPWLLAASQDIAYPGVRMELTDPRLTRDSEARRQFSDLVGATSVREPMVSAAASQVTTLSAPVSSLEAPQIVAALRRGPRLPELTEPPFTDTERAFLSGSVTAPAGSH